MTLTGLRQLTVYITAAPPTLTQDDLESGAFLMPLQHVFVEHAHQYSLEDRCRTR